MATYTMTPCAGKCDEFMAPSGHRSMNVKKVQLLQSQLLQRHLSPDQTLQNCWACSLPTWGECFKLTLGWRVGWMTTDTTLAS